MDGLIRTAWRAFWVGLGASAVLIGQSVLQPAPAAPTNDPSSAPLVAPAPLNPPAAQRAPSVRRNGVLSRCETVANVTRCS